jgi:hypothetical protein
MVFETAQALFSSLFFIVSLRVKVILYLQFGDLII